MEYHEHYFNINQEVIIKDASGFNVKPNTKGVIVWLSPNSDMVSVFFYKYEKTVTLRSSCLDPVKTAPMNNKEQALQRIKNLEDQVEKSKKELDELRKIVEEPDTKRKQPGIGGTYYLKTSEGFVGHGKWQNNDGDKYRWRVGNVYRTEEECIREERKWTLLREITVFAKEHNNPNVTPVHWIYFDKHCNGIYSSCQLDSKLGPPFCSALFTSDEVAKKCIEYFGSRLNILINE